MHHTAHSPSFRASLVLALAAVAAGAVTLQAASHFGKTKFYDDVSVESYTAISTTTVAYTTGGIYTNGTYTNRYRVCATNLKGRIPLSSTWTYIWTGATNCSNALTLYWPAKAGVACYIVEKAYAAGGPFTNWYRVSVLHTNWTDTGTNVPSGTAAFTNSHPTVIPAPTVPWGTSTGLTAEIAARKAGDQAGSNYADSVRAFATNNPVLSRDGLKDSSTGLTRFSTLGDIVDDEGYAVMSAVDEGMSVGRAFSDPNGFPIFAPIYQYYSTDRAWFDTLGNLRLLIRTNGLEVTAPSTGPNFLATVGQITAAQAGALPSTGGVVSGSVNLQGMLTRIGNGMSVSTLQIDDNSSLTDGDGDAWYDGSSENVYPRAISNAVREILGALKYRIVPAASNVYDLASVHYPWRTGYFHTVVASSNTFLLGNTSLKAAPGGGDVTIQGGGQTGLVAYVSEVYQAVQDAMDYTDGATGAVRVTSLAVSTNAANLKGHAQSRVITNAVREIAGTGLSWSGGKLISNAVTNGQPIVVVGTNLTISGEIMHDSSTAADFDLRNADQDKDILLKINDGGTNRTAIQINGTEGSVTMPRQSYVIAYLSADQTIAHATVTTVIFGTEAVDTLGEYNTSTGVFTAKHAGRYVVTAMINWNATDVNNNYQARINGVAYNIMTGPSTTALCQPISAVVTLGAGGAVQVYAAQYSGGNETIEGTGAYVTTLCITKAN